LSSAVLALAAAAAMIWLELSALPHAAMLPRLVSLSPTLAMLALAVYAICAILLMSGDLVADGLRVRYYLGRYPADHGRGRAGWTAAFAGSGFRRLVPPATAMQPSSGSVDGTVVLPGRFRPHEARREVARLYYIGAARVHFFSALVILAAGVVLGAVQARSPLPFVPGPIPTVPAALAVAALILLAVLARIAVDVAAEPVIETISQQPVESVEAGLLRRTSELLAAAPTAYPLAAAVPPEAMVRIPDRLGAVLEQSHLALIEAIERLSLTTDGLAQTTKSSLEALEAAFRATERHDQAMTQPSTFSTGVTVLEQGHLALIEAIERLSLTTDGLAQTTKSSLEALEAAFRADERHDETMTKPSASSTDVRVLEQGHLALIEAIERLSVTTDGLAQTTKSSLEALEAGFRANERLDQTMTQPNAFSTEVTELREALAALTEILQRPRPALAAESDGERAAASARNREPDLALELHKLLQEIESR
jgi:hypothetical protein